MQSLERYRIYLLVVGLIFDFAGFLVIAYAVISFHRTAAKKKDYITDEMETGRVYAQVGTVIVAIGFFLIIVSEMMPLWLDH